VSEILSAVKFLVAIAGGWVVVSLVTTAALLPVFKAMARVNALEKLRARNDDWSMTSIRTP
jgi:hypothetical protein